MWTARDTDEAMDTIVMCGCLRSGTTIATRQLPEPYLDRLHRHGFEV